VESREARKGEALRRTLAARGIPLTAPQAAQLALDLLRLAGDGLLVSSAPTDHEGHEPHLRQRSGQR